MNRLLNITRTDFGFALTVAIVWQAAMTLVGYSLAPDQGLLGHMSHWDAGWYKNIIEHAYSEQASPAAPAFYPLYPLVVYTFTTLTFGILSQELIALLINTVALGFALVAIKRIVATFNTGIRQQYTAVAGFLCFPSAFFLHTFYTESLFIAMALWAYLFALQRKWWAMGVVLAMLTASRLPSLLFVALCGLEYLRSYDWDIRQAVNKNILWFVLAPLGFVVYGLFLLMKRGDFLAMFSAYKKTDDWTYQVFDPNILQTLYETVARIAAAISTGQFNYDIFINYALPLTSVIAVFIASIYLLKVRKSKAWPLSIFGFLSIIMFTLNSNVVSVHRYALVCVVIFVALSIFISTSRRTCIIYALLAASLVVQLFIYNKFINSIFAG